jgi:hypothetical protein
MKNVSPVAGVLLAGSILSFSALSQEAWMSDRDVMQDLRANGSRYERDSATLYFEREALSSEEMDAFSDLANPGHQRYRKAAEGSRREEPRADRKDLLFREQPDRYRALQGAHGVPAVVARAARSRSVSA